jgi:cation diffusion facilitator family transporter
MVIGSIERIVTPQVIHYKAALIVATLGLAVNIVCAMILGGAHHTSHHDAHDHDHDERPNHHDLNLRSVYLHVLADAATSVLAIVALMGGWLYGWSWLDPLMGIVGAVLVAIWATHLLRDTGKILLDREMDHSVVDDIREVVETPPDAGGTRIADIHVWRIGKNSYACVLSLVTHDVTLTSTRVREQFARHKEIAHATIEINQCG